VTDLIGAVEAGGTKFICAIGDTAAQILAREVFPTESPAQTLTHAFGFFKRHARRGNLVHIGIASFGPIDLDPRSPSFGRITTTPKQLWRDFDILDAVARGTGVRGVSLDTDVNCAALAEWQWGAGRGCDPLLYVTLGTGIGAGVVINGSVLHGLVHPEIGHMRIPHDCARDPFAGSCPSHRDCWEGLASGSAIAARRGVPAADLPPDDPMWPLVTTYTADGFANLILAYSPRRIIVGGGLRTRVIGPDFLRRVHERLNGYLRAAELLDGIVSYIVPSQLGDDAGVLGAMALALRSLRVSQDAI